MFSYVKIPKQREGVLIGKKGKTKKIIESITNTKINVKDSVEICGNAINVICACNIVKAIARGFSPEKALELTDENKILIILELPKKKNVLKRTKSRLIGSKGKFRKNLELMLDVHISIYGSTVSIIGSYEKAHIAKQAIEMIIQGYSHKAVYGFLNSVIK